MCKCSRMQSARPAFFGLHGATVDRHFISKLLPSKQKARPQRWCTVCQKCRKGKDSVYQYVASDIGRCVWQVFKTTAPISIPKVIKYFLHSSYKFTLPKVILKQLGAGILILCIFLIIVSVLYEKTISSEFIAVQMKLCIFYRPCLNVLCHQD